MGDLGRSTSWEGGEEASGKDAEGRDLPTPRPRSADAQLLPVINEHEEIAEDADDQEEGKEEEISDEAGGTCAEHGAETYEKFSKEVRVRWLPAHHSLLSPSCLRTTDTGESCQHKTDNDLHWKARAASACSSCSRSRRS